VKNLILSLFWLLLIKTTYGFTVHGTVYGANSERLSYSNIYIKGTSNGTSANDAGQYSLNLPAGKYDIVFQHLGYRQQVESITLTRDTEINVTLQLVQYEIRDVIINGNEDPAIAIIRKAIEKRKYFLNAVESYSCNVYMKGMGRINKSPESILGFRLSKSGSHNSPDKTGIFYLSEAQSKLYYMKPGKFHEEIYSSKVSGRAEGYTINSAEDFYFNFYDRSINIPIIATRPFISPLSENAFFFYNYKMLGAFKEGDKYINRILVTPKRASDPCFSGVLSIVDDNWNIHSLELYLLKKNGLEYVDTLKITQYFVPIKDDLWLPVQQRYDVTGGFLGIEGDGYYTGVFSNYQLNDLFGMEPKVPPVDSAKSPKKEEKKKKKQENKIEHKIFTPEIVKVDAEANKRSTAYWDSIRPIPLNKIELDDYVRKDSIEVIRKSKEFQDTINRERNKFAGRDLIFGYTYVKSAQKFSIHLPGLADTRSQNTIINYNTVEGANINLPFRIAKVFKNKKAIGFDPVFRYGFANRHFNAMGTLKFRNNQLHNEYFTLTGGKYISQFNDEQPQTEFGNTWQTLIFRNNFMKIYEQYFIKAGYSRELFNGLDGAVNVGYAERMPLENESAHSIFSRDLTFTPNGVDLPGIEYHEGNIQQENIFWFNVQLHFTFGRKYITYPDQRIRIDESNFPELWLIYKKAIPIGGFSELNYDFIEAKLSGKIPMKLLGTLFYRFGGGGFPNNANTDYADYQHFYGNFLNTSDNDLLGFYLLQYYRESTNQYFAEAHMEQHFGGFLFHKIPGIRNLKLGEVLGFHFLYTPTRQEYFQIDAGIDNILKVMRVDFVTGFDGQTVHRFGVRIGLNLGFIR